MEKRLVNGSTLTGDRRALEMGVLLNFVLHYMVSGYAVVFLVAICFCKITIDKFMHENATVLFHTCS